MIVLHTNADCPQCRQVEAALRDMVFSHRMEPSPPGCGHSLSDHGRDYHGHESMQSHLEELAHFRERWYRYQSDACYCWDDED